MSMHDPDRSDEPGKLWRFLADDRLRAVVPAFITTFFLLSAYAQSLKADGLPDGDVAIAVLLISLAASVGVAGLVVLMKWFFGR